jgi:hypothetical protein
MKKAVGIVLLAMGIAALIVACGPAAPKTVKLAYSSH